MLEFLVNDDVYEATNYTAAKVMEVEDNARKEYLSHQNKDYQNKESQHGQSARTRAAPQFAPCASSARAWRL